LFNDNAFRHFDGPKSRAQVGHQVMASVQSHTMIRASALNVETLDLDKSC
jgi:hypothetical protein